MSDTFDSTDDKRVTNLPGDPNYTGPDHVSLSYKALGDEEKELMRQFKVDCQLLINKIEEELGTHPELNHAIRHIIDASANITRYITRYHADNTTSVSFIRNATVSVGASIEEKVTEVLKTMGVFIPTRLIDAATDTKDEKKVEVYSQPNCTFVYCPNPEECKADGCINPHTAKT